MPLVGKGREGWFFLLFTLQFCVYTGLAASHAHSVGGGGWLATFVGVLALMPGIIGLSSVSSIVFLEGIAMLSERYLKRRYEEGKAEGEARMSKAWEAWLKRRMEAEEAGEDFDEPPPSHQNGK